MTATNHVLTGAIIGLAVSNPFLAVTAAFLSHFVLDALPHYGNKNLTSRLFINVLLADSLVAGTFLLSLAILQPLQWQLAFICGIAAASPDLMWMPGWIRELRGQSRLKNGVIRRFHKNIQWAEKSQNYPAEFVWLGGCALIIAYLI